MGRHSFLFRKLGGIFQLWSGLGLFSGVRLIDLDLDVVAEEDLDPEEDLDLELRVDLDLEVGGDLSSEQDGDFAWLKGDRRREL